VSSSPARRSDREWTGGDERRALGVVPDPAALSLGLDHPGVGAGVVAVAVLGAGAICDRCAGRMADCLVCGNSGRLARLAPDEEFDGS